MHDREFSELMWLNFIERKLFYKKFKLPLEYIGKKIYNSNIVLQMLSDSN